MIRGAWLAVLLAVVACGESRPRIVTFAGQLPEPVVPLAWLEGRWDEVGGAAVEHFSAAGPALFGVAFEDGIDVLVVEAPGGRVQLTTLGAGGASETAGLAAKGKTFATFANETRRVRYERRRGQLVVTEAKRATRFDRRDPGRSAELDDADRRWLSGDVNQVAPEIVTLAGMERHVVASAPSPAGDVGFTIGLYRSPDGKQRGGYIAIWDKDAARGWTLRLVTARGS